jgi:hypothetical protein
MAKTAAIRTKSPARRMRSTVPMEVGHTMSQTMSEADIARRAFELYLARGGSEGDALSDWYRAEQELTAMR